MGFLLLEGRFVYEFSTSERYICIYMGFLVAEGMFIYISSLLLKGMFLYMGSLQLEGIFLYMGSLLLEGMFVYGFSNRLYRKTNYSSVARTVPISICWPSSVQANVYNIIC